MKICWDNLEGIHLTRNGTLVRNTSTYIYRDSCAKCGNPYLTRKDLQSSFCGKSCAQSGENHHMYGKTHTIETINKMSRSVTGVLNGNYKGGIRKLGLAAYTTYKAKLGHYESVRKQISTEILEVRCAYCGGWYTPTRDAVHNRLAAINNLDRGEHRFYCSDNCKESCPIYYQKKHPKGFKKATSREVSTYLRQIVFERDNWECQKCGKTGKEVALHCHHIKGYAQNKILANDVDNCITLCKGCHKEVHKLPGCRYVDLRCK